MKYDRLYYFISPVTGKLLLPKGYSLLGDKDGKSFVSPVLIDIRQDIIDLRKQIGNFQELKKLSHNRIWIGDYTNEPQEVLQIGIINLPPLAEAVFPNPLSSITGDFRIPNPTFNYLSAFEWLMSGPFLPQIYATKYDLLGNPIGTDVSSSLAMTQVRAAQIMKRFDNADFIVGSSNVSFEWENPKMLLMPEQLRQLYGLGTTYNFTKAQSLGSLETGLLKNTVNNAKGRLSKAISGEDYLDLNNPVANMEIALIRPEVLVDGVDKSKFISRSGIKFDDIPTKEETYITRTKSDKLPNSIALKNLIGLLHPNGGLLKIDNTGTPAIARGGSIVLLDDYLTPADYVDLNDKINALGRGLAEALEIQLAADVILVIADLLGFASQVASNSRLNELRDQTIILNKAGDNRNTFKTRYNVIFDNNDTGGTNTNWEYGVSLLAEDTSLTETLGNTIHPIYFRIGGKSNYITYDNTARFFELKVDFLNDGTKVKKWYPKKLTFSLSKQDYVKTDRSGYQTTHGELIDKIFDYDVDTKQLNFYQKTSFEHLTATKSLNIPVMRSIDIPSNSITGAMFFCNDL